VTLPVARTTENVTQTERWRVGGVSQAAYWDRISAGMGPGSIKPGS
jgi:hypothetical protein